MQQLIIGYNTAMVCQGPVLAHLRQYWPEGFSQRANASEGVPIPVYLYAAPGLLELNFQ